MAKMVPLTLFTALLALVPGIQACTDQVESCFQDYYSFSIADVANYCDYVNGAGEQCLIEKDAQLDNNNMNKRLIQCHRLNQGDKKLAHLAWRYLAYCYYNKPNDAVFPECFDKIKEKCNKPSSAECKTACEPHFTALDSDHEFKTSKEDNSDKDKDEKSSDGAVVGFSLVSAVLTFLMAL